MGNIKETSYSYGKEYQNQQIAKYRNRYSNHWKYRMQIFDYLLSKIKTSNSQKDTLIADIGTSIGTFALEAAHKGYDSIGIDFDPDAIEIAKQLAKEEQVDAKFICGDVSQDIGLDNKIDIAICFDIFEHLHDDEFGALLLSLKAKLKKEGKILFHTFPNQYDYLFFEKTILMIPLIPWSIFPNKFFNRIVKIYASFIDIALILLIGKTYKEKIKTKSHCNPLTQERLQDIFIRSGYEIEILESKQLYKLKKRTSKIFKKHPISYRNIYGIIKPKTK